MKNKFLPRAKFFLTFLLGIAVVSSSVITDAKVDFVSDVLKDESQKLYATAAKKYYRLLDGDKFSRDIKNWQATIAEFSKIVADHPNFVVAPKSLYNIGKLYNALFRIHHDLSYLASANQAYQSLVDAYPNIYLADDALVQIARNYRYHLQNTVSAKEVYLNIIKEYPKSEFLNEAKNALAKIDEDSAASRLSALPPTDSKRQATTLANSGDKKQLAVIEDVQRWTNSDWSRVLLKVSQDVIFKYAVLDDSNTGHSRFYIDVLDSVLGDKIKKSSLNQKGIIESLKIAQFSPNIVRTVIELSENYDIQVYEFENEGEYKIVIDILTKVQNRDWGIAKKENFDKQRTIEQNQKSATVAKNELVAPKNKLEQAATPYSQDSNSTVTTKTASKTANSGSQKPLSLAGALGLKVNSIIIDPGHGGRDPGALGFGLKEKDITLSVAKHLKNVLLQNQPALEVFLTRDQDIFISLEDRTAFANKHRGDLFVSLHVNASRNKKLFGVESYFLNLSSDQASLELAAIENASSLKSISQLQTILEKVLAGNKLQESKQLASMIQDSIFRKTQVMKFSKNIGVKQAPFVVLIGAEMPAVLIEIGFISHQLENKRLRDNAYLASLSAGIADGLLEYISRVSKGYGYAKN